MAKLRGSLAWWSFLWTAKCDRPLSKQIKNNITNNLTNATTGDKKECVCYYVWGCTATEPAVCIENCLFPNIREQCDVNSLRRAVFKAYAANVVMHSNNDRKLLDQQSDCMMPDKGLSHGFKRKYQMIIDPCTNVEMGGTKKRSCWSDYIYTDWDRQNLDTLNSDKMLIRRMRAYHIGNKDVDEVKMGWDAEKNKIFFAAFDLGGNSNSYMHFRTFTTTTASTAGDRGQSQEEDPKSAEPTGKTYYYQAAEEPQNYLAYDRFPFDAAVDLATPENKNLTTTVDKLFNALKEAYRNEGGAVDPYTREDLVTQLNSVADVFGFANGVTKADPEDNDRPINRQADQWVTNEFERGFDIFLVPVYQGQFTSFVKSTVLVEHLRKPLPKWLATYFPLPATPTKVDQLNREGVRPYGYPLYGKNVLEDSQVYTFFSMSVSKETRPNQKDGSFYCAPNINERNLAEYVNCADGELENGWDSTKWTNDILAAQSKALVTEAEMLETTYGVTPPYRGHDVADSRCRTHPTPWRIMIAFAAVLSV